MNCPNCISSPLKAKLTKKGVEIDHCARCGGMWLDEGEIYSFSKKPKELAEVLERAIANTQPSKRLSPKTNQPMKKVPLMGGKLTIDICPRSNGVWLNAGEGKKLISTDPKLLLVQTDDTKIWPPKPGTRKPPSQQKPAQTPPTGSKRNLKGAPALASLPNLFVRSTMTMTLLYGMVILALITAVEFAGLNLNLAIFGGVGFALLQFALGPFFMDLMLNWFYKMDWLTPHQLPRHLNSFLTNTCRDNNMEIPRFGLIRDGAPNAFTYGHTPNNARIVITQGILDLLEEGEVEGVVAHEIGHAKHWDMFLMTVAQMVPLILYYIYRLLVGSDSSKERDGRVAAVGIGAYILYIISEYAVLWFSRTREYYADRFAANVTGKPNDLASALVKIGYGLAGQGSDKEKGEKGEESNRKSTLEAVGALGIFDAGIARGFAAASVKTNPDSGELETAFDKNTVAETMRWDLWNPWAKYYELHSTHPLIANRLNYLSNQAEVMGQEPYIVFNLTQPESYWDEFLVDVGIMFLWLPVVIGTAVLYFVMKTNLVLAGGIALLGIAMLVKLKFSYPSQFFPRIKISGLLKIVKVSAVRATPCKIKGRIIGRGVPGLIWSEDSVMRDETGILFLDYRQPLWVFEFFFGLMRRKELDGAEVNVTGWYRRSPVPYLEIDKMTANGKTYNCYVYIMKLVFAWLLIIGGGVYASRLIFFNF